MTSASGFSQNNTASIMAFSDTREANEEATLFGSPDDIIAKVPTAARIRAWSIFC